MLDALNHGQVPEPQCTVPLPLIIFQLNHCR